MAVPQIQLRSVRRSLSCRWSLLSCLLFQRKYSLRVVHPWQCWWCLCQKGWVKLLWTVHIMYTQTILWTSSNPSSIFHESFVAFDSAVAASDPMSCTLRLSTTYSPLSREGGILGGMWWSNFPTSVLSHLANQTQTSRWYFDANSRSVLSIWSIKGGDVKTFPGVIYYLAHLALWLIRSYQYL